MYDGPQFKNEYSNNSHKLLRDKYNVSKSEMHSLLINAFHIPVDIAAVACRQYFTRKWLRLGTSVSFSGVIHEGLINHNGLDYLVVYYQCTPYQVRKANALMLSYRQPQPEFNLPAYVLIKLLNEGE